jgi:hypothetical protein
MTRLFFGLVLIVAGAVLLYYGWQAHQSFASTASNAVTGAPTSKSIWLLVTGALGLVSGLFTLFRGNP